MRPGAKKALRAIVILVLLVLVGLGLFIFVMSAPLPRDGVTGPEADALAHRLEQAMNKDAWDATQAVEWTHAKRNRHLWDRRRGFDRVRFKDAEVLLDLWNGGGLAFENGKPAEAAKTKMLIDKAYAAWINDSFWLAPLSKLFDEGVTRSKVTLQASEGSDVGLLVQYSSGGLTPGDAYLWPVPKEGMPPAWRMWVSIVFIKGARVLWTDWQTLGTGVKVSTHHEILGGLVKFDLEGLRGAKTLGELTDGNDPFAPLVDLRSRRASN